MTKQSRIQIRLFSCVFFFFFFFFGGGGVLNQTVEHIGAQL